MKITEADLIKGCIGVLSSIMVYTEPIHYIVFFTFACVLVDAVTGIIKSRKLGLGIESERFRKGLPKLAMYVVLILLFWGLDYAMGTVNNRMPLAVIVGCIMSMCEMWSILENCTDIFPDAKVFIILKKFMKDKTKEVLNVDLECDKECDSKKESVKAKENAGN